LAILPTTNVSLYGVYLGRRSKSASLLLHGGGRT
jgi:hypothetical protein